MSERATLRKNFRGFHKDFEGFFSLFIGETTIITEVISINVSNTRSTCPFENQNDRYNDDDASIPSHDTRFPRRFKFNKENNYLVAYFGAA